MTERITKITAKVCRELGDEALALLEPFARERGLIVEYRGGQFDGQQAILKVAFVLKHTEDGVSVAESRFRSLASAFGFDPDDFGRKFRYKHRVYTITGLNPGAAKYSINAKRDDGREYRFPAYVVKMNLLPKDVRGPASSAFSLPAGASIINREDAW